MTTTAASRAGRPAEAEHTHRWRTARSWLPAGLVAAFLASQALAALGIDRLGVDDARNQWDGEWYLSIADHGYPTGGSPGAPPEGYDAYAFHPLYPMLVRALGLLPGLTTAGVALWVNLVLATLAVAVLAEWAARRLGPVAAAVCVGAIIVWPSSPVFQLAYTEGLALLLLVLVWRFVDAERYLAASVAIAVLSLARPLATPLAAAVAVVAVLRWWDTRSWRETRGLVGVVASAGVATLAWPVYAGLRSGDPGVYWAAHTAFARPGAPTSPAAWGLQVPLIGILVVLVLATTTIIGVKLLPRTTPTLLRAWVVVYPIYLAVGSLVTSSLVRYFMLTFPAALCLLPVARHRVLGPALLFLSLAMGLVAGAWWIREFVPPVADGVYP